MCYNCPHYLQLLYLPSPTTLLLINISCRNGKDVRQPCAPSPLASLLAKEYSMKCCSHNRHLYTQTCITSQKASLSSPKQQPMQLQQSQMLFFFSFFMDAGCFSGEYLFSGEEGRVQVPVWDIPVQEGSWEEEEGWASRLFPPSRWAGSARVEQQIQLGLPWPVPGSQSSPCLRHLAW